MARYCDADDMKDFDFGLVFREKLAEYVNSIVTQAQADAWEEGYRAGEKGYLLNNPYKEG